MAKNVNVKGAFADPLQDSLREWNNDKNLSWDLGTNYSNIGTQFQTYVNNFLFPKLQSTKSIQTALGNKFNFLAQETEYISQLNEEYAIMDSVPTDLNLDKEAELMFKRNYPKMRTRLYGAGVHKKQKFTLNDNDNRLNWLNLSDALRYTVDVYRKKISDINYAEEAEIRAMLVDYAINQMTSKNKRTATNIDTLSTAIFEVLLNIQNNSSKYNEADKASGNPNTRYTTNTNLEDVMILTTDKVKTYLLDTKIANTFQMSGIDFTQRVVSFDDLGGVWKLNDDCTIVASDLEKFDAMSDYQMAPGDTIQKGTVFTYDITNFDSFKNHVTELKPANNLWALVFDTNCIYYKRNTSKLLPTYFYNNELDEYTYWMHYYSFKAVSPFYNKILVSVP